MFPNYNPQNSSGTGISLNVGNTQPTSPIQLQPAVNVMDPAYDPVSSGGPQVQSMSTTAPTQTVDPYAQWGGQSNYNNLVNNFNSQVGNVESTSGLAGQNAALGQKTAISDKMLGWKNAQADLDNQSVQNTLAKQSGMKGIMDWVGQGIRSGGVMLANKNASNSSAADALGRAYGQLGREQAAGINQQYAQGQNQVGLNRTKLVNEIQQNINDLPAWKTMTVNSIVSNAQQQLGQIDQAMAYESLPNRVDMEAEKQKITANVLQQLQDLDGALAQAQNIQPLSSDQVASQANQLFQSGTAPANAFNFSTQVPLQFQNTGPQSSELPLFTVPTSSKDQLQPA